MSSKSDYIVIVDAGQACICNQYGGVRNRVGEYGAMYRRICPGFNAPERISAEAAGLPSIKSAVVAQSSTMMVV